MRIVNPVSLRRFLIAIVCLLMLASAGCGRHRGRRQIVSEVTMGNENYKARVLRGVYDGATLWKWTAPSFALSLDPPSDSKPTFLEMDLAVPDELMGKAPAVTPAAKVTGWSRPQSGNSRRALSPAPRRGLQARVHHTFPSRPHNHRRRWYDARNQAA